MIRSFIGRVVCVLALEQINLHFYFRQSPVVLLRLVSAVEHAEAYTAHLHPVK